MKKGRTLECSEVLVEEGVAVRICVLSTDGRYRRSGTIKRTKESSGHGAPCCSLPQVLLTVYPFVSVTCGQWEQEWYGPEILLYYQNNFNSLCHNPKDASWAPVYCDGPGLQQAEDAWSFCPCPPPSQWPVCFPCAQPDRIRPRSGAPRLPRMPAPLAPAQPLSIARWLRKDLGAPGRTLSTPPHIIHFLVAQSWRLWTGQPTSTGQSPELGSAATWKSQALSAR